ncbi:hypothetical protein BD779DRAFT_1804023 [Infundibulicybe gibba]|nr:hypothetical protein BD779DRAFT_1804023 [Infundibulicybe gibba]
MPTAITDTLPNNVPFGGWRTAELRSHPSDPEWLLFQCQDAPFSVLPSRSRLDTSSTTPSTSSFTYIFWLASRDDRSTLLALSRVSMFLHEVCKPLVPSPYTLSQTTYITDLMQLGHRRTETQVELYRQLVNIPDMGHIQKLRDEYPSKTTIRAEQFLYGRPYSSPRPCIEREMCDRETQVESGDSEVPSWVGTSQYIIRKPQPPPQGYLLDYPTDLLTRIFELACIDDPAASRLLCLVSKGFYIAVKPVMFYWIQLKKLNQILRFVHLVSADAVARVGIRRLTIETLGIGLEKTLLLEELDWNEKDSFGKFYWDSNYWGDPGARYIYRSKGLGDSDELEDSSELASSDESEYSHELAESSDESEDSYDSDEELDIEQDVAFLASPEGQLRKNLTYGLDGELTDGARWPWDIGLNKVESLINNATSDILHTVAPVLWNLKFILKHQKLNITLPVFPELSELTIHVTLLHLLGARPHVLFPALKYLCIQGSLGDNRINLDDVTHHAPVITEIQVPFGRDFLRTFIEKLAIPLAASMGGKRRGFEHVEKVYVGQTIYEQVYEVFGPDEPQFATWKSLVHFRPQTDDIF